MKLKGTHSLQAVKEFISYFAKECINNENISQKGSPNIKKKSNKCYDVTENVQGSLNHQLKIPGIAHPLSFVSAVKKWKLWWKTDGSSTKTSISSQIIRKSRQIEGLRSYLRNSSNTKKLSLAWKSISAKQWSMKKEKKGKFTSIFSLCAPLSQPNLFSFLAGIGTTLWNEL